MNLDVLAWILEITFILLGCRDKNIVTSDLWSLFQVIPFRGRRAFSDISAIPVFNPGSNRCKCTMNISCASVPRSHRHHHHQHQQQQTVFYGSPGSASAPPTPRSRQEGSRRPARRPISITSKTGGGSPCYAGSKFSDSPTARSIPLPPTEWIYEAYSSSQSESGSMSSGSIGGGQSDMETSSICSSAPSLSDVGEVAVIPTTPKKSALRPPSGMRVHPLRLIAAVAAS